MNKFSPTATINYYWDTYTKNYNLLADCLLENNIDINLLRKTIKSYKNYQRQLLRVKLNDLLKEVLRCI